MRHSIICFLHKLFSGAVINATKISGRVSEVKKPLEDLDVDEKIISK
jgi:hypothetical protein